MIEVAEAESLEAVLDARGDPMAACSLPWLAHFADVPDDAAVPLAMSGPHPRAVGSYGAECIAWAKAELGLTLRWWQALAVTRQLEHDEDGVLVWREIVESGPRRIGKSVRLRASALWRLVNADRFLETQLAMLVSKDLAVGKEIHRGSWRWAEQKGWGVLRINGGQEVETPAGDRWLLRAPNAAYGYDVGYGQVDESWDVDPQAITDGLEPALLERHSAQLHLTSTAHARASSLMRRRLTAALRSADQDVLLLLWGARPGADVGDEATWRAASPHWSKDRRDLIARKYAAALAGQDEPEFDDPDPIRGWAAQYLNVWPLLMGSATGGIFTHWANRGVDREPPTPAAIGVAVSIDRAWASIGVSSSGDLVHLGSHKRARGTEWVVAEVVRIHEQHNIPVVIHGRGPGADLIKPMQDAGLEPIVAGIDDYQDACANLFDAVEAGTVEHGNYDDLNEAVSVAGWTSGERPVWTRQSGDVSMLEAVTLAKWGAQQAIEYDVLQSIF